MGTGTRRTPAVRRFRRSSPLGRPGRFLKLLTALLAGSLLAGLMALIPAAVAGAASTSSEASEAFVAVGGSSPELEAVDTTSGSLVGSPVALSYVPTGVVEYASSPHAVPEIVEVVVAEGSSSEEASVQAVDPTTETSSAAVCLLSDCADAAPGQVAAADVSSSAQYVLVLLPSLDELAVVDVDSSPVAVSQLLSLGFSSGGSPSGIAVSHDGSVAYVTDKGSNQLKTLFYDSSSTPFEVEHTYSGSAGFDPTSLVIDRETNQALISDGSNLDIATLSSGEMTGVTSQVSLSGCGSSVTAGSVVLDALGTNAYVQLASADSVADVTVATGAVTCLSPGFSPGPLALTDDGGTLAVTASSSASLGLYSTQASYVGDLENSVSLSATPVAIASAADLSLDREAYVALGPSGELAMVDLTTDALDQTVDLGTGTDPDAVAVSPDGQFVYVADYGTNEVSVVQTDLMDSPDDPVVATVSLPSGSEPDSLAVSP
ncbi:MAG: YncE family protein, partial [Acidimicrobiales bacterium]